MEQHRTSRTFVLLALVTFARCTPTDVAVTTDSTTAVATSTSKPTTVTTDHTVTKNVLNIAIANSDASTKPVQIDVYYEALCIDSVKFFKDQLIPVYNTFNKFVDVKVYPFAKGNYKADDSIECDRAGECFADTIHACGISKISDINKLLGFLNCALTEGYNKANKTIPLDKCGEDNGIEKATVDSISECANNKSEWSPLLKNYSDLAKTAEVKNVPKIFINKVYTEEIQKLVEKNLKQAVCDKIPNKDSVSECKQTISGAGALVVNSVPAFIGLYYLITML